MQLYMGSGSTAPFILISVLDGDEWPASRPGHFIARKEPPVPSEQESGWALESFWKFYIRGESLTSVQIRKPKRPARNYGCDSLAPKLQMALKLFSGFSGLIVIYDAVWM